MKQRELEMQKRFSQVQVNENKSTKKQNLVRFIEEKSNSNDSNDQDKVKIT